APLAVPFLRRLVDEHVPRLLDSARTRPLRAARAAFVAWARDEAPRGDGFYRVALLFDTNEHGFVDLGPEVDLPLYKVGYMPAAPDALAALNVRFVLTDRTLEAPAFAQLRELDGLTLYRVRDWDPRPFAVVAGQGEVALERFADEEVVLRAGKGASGTLRLNV